jgi:hypothetical protein
MRILLVASRYPVPARRGNQVRTGEWLAALDAHELVLLCPQPARRGPKVVSAGWASWPISPVRSLRGVLGALTDGRPLQEGLYDSRAARTTVTRALAEHRPDVVVVQMVRCGWAADLAAASQPEVPVVFDAIDAMGLHFDRAAAGARWPLQRVYAHEAARCRQRERSLALRAQRSVAVSQRDLDALAVPTGCGRVVPVAGREVANRRQPVRERKVVLTGNLGYRPTILAARWFADRVWPRVLEQVPDATWVLAGARPSRRLGSVISRRGVELQADVADMAAVLGSARVAIAPMSSGSGVPMKVLEACAAGVPVVVDPWAAAGLVESGREAVAIADEPEAWAETVVRLLRDDEAAARLGGRGHELWKMHYHPEVIARQIRDVVVEASASKP